MTFMRGDRKFDPVNLVQWLLFGIAIFIILSLAVPAFGQQTSTSSGPKIKIGVDSTNTNENTNTLTSENVNTNNNESNSESVSSASVGNSTSSVTLQGQKQVASANAPGIFSSHACAYSRAAAIGLRDINIGGGGQRIDPECSDREWARLMFAFGMVDEARELACMSASGQKLTVCQSKFPEMVVTVPEVDTVLADAQYKAVQAMLTDTAERLEDYEETRIIAARNAEISKERERQYNMTVLEQVKAIAND